MLHEKINMLKQQILQTKLIEKFSPHFILVENESHRHSSELGGESHFKVVIVSDYFENITKISRHRQIYQLLSDEFHNGLHALSLHIYTLSEWELLEKVIPKSTSCITRKK